MYYPFRFATIVLPLLPRKLVIALANVIGWIAWLVASKARKQATSNILHVLDMRTLETRIGRRRLRRTVRGMFQQSARNWLEMCLLPSLQTETILRLIHVQGLEHIDAALAQGKGVILFSAHIGPFDYLVQLAAVKGYHVTIPVERLKDQRMLDLLLKLRCSHGVQFLPLGGSSPMRAIIQELKQNHIVLIAVDRAIQGQTVEVPFFGASALLPVGPVMLAQRTGAVLIGGFSWRVSDSDLRGECVPLSLSLPEEERMHTERVMRGIAEMMEHFIAAHPEQWAVFAPVWTGKKCS